MRPHLRADVARYARRLHAAGWVANHDGNVSVRVGRDRFLCTPTAVSKADVDESMLLVVDGTGKVIEGSRKPFGELDVHLALYRARPDQNAVVHAHPVTATAFGVSGVSLEVSVLPEFLVSLGPGVPTVPLHLPKTPQLLAGVGEAARRSNAFITAGNGVWSMGVDLEQAYLRMELVEHYARIVASARQLGGLRELSADQIAKLLEARRKAGLEPPDAILPNRLDAPLPPAAPVPKPEGKGVPARPAGAGMPPDYEQLAERVISRLGGRLPSEGELRKLLLAEMQTALVEA